MFLIIKNKNKELCCAYKCSNKQSKKDRFCSKHSKRYQKEVNPINYAYNTLKCNAKRRGKSFELTLDQFKEFCQQTDYINLKGKTASSLSIDRIKQSEGYHYNNIQPLTLSENSKKGTSKNEDLPF